MNAPSATELADGDNQLSVRRWPYGPHTVPHARHDFRGVIRGWGLAEDVGEVAEIVLSELLTNALRYARTPRGRLIETRYEHRGDGVLRIEVHDASDGLPLLRQAAEDDESGRGLALVDALTERRWGVSSRVGVGKLVWAHVGPAT